MKEIIMNKIKKIALRTGALFAGAVVLSAPAHAAIETAAITAALTDAGTAAAVVGAAVLVVMVGIKAFKYIRSAM